LLLQHEHLLLGHYQKLSLGPMSAEQTLARGDEVVLLSYLAAYLIGIEAWLTAHKSVDLQPWAECSHL
jgi:hypothetical protein